MPVQFFKGRIWRCGVLEADSVTIINDLLKIKAVKLKCFSAILIKVVNPNEKVIFIKSTCPRRAMDVERVIKKYLKTIKYSLMEPITVCSKEEFFDGVHPAVSNSQENLASSTDETVPTLPFKSASIADDIHTLAVAAERICDSLTEIADKGITLTFGNK